MTRIASSRCLSFFLSRFKVFDLRHPWHPVDSQQATNTSWDPYIKHPRHSKTHPHQPTGYLQVKATQISPAGGEATAVSKHAVSNIAATKPSLLSTISFIDTLVVYISTWAQVKPSTLTLQRIFPFPSFMLYKHKVIRCPRASEHCLRSQPHGLFPVPGPVSELQFLLLLRQIEGPMVSVIKGGHRMNG